MEKTETVAFMMKDILNALGEGGAVIPVESTVKYLEFRIFGKPFETISASSC